VAGCGARPRFNFGFFDVFDRVGFPPARRLTVGSQAAIRPAVPASPPKALAAGVRWILPLEVFGMLPALISAILDLQLVFGGHVAAHRFEHRLQLALRRRSIS